MTTLPNREQCDNRYLRGISPASTAMPGAGDCVSRVAPGRRGRRGKIAGFAGPCEEPVPVIDIHTNGAQDLD
ncbi:hypothetical protein B0G77_2038 [Paraburkholderia sp. BL10I2N1]|nr:hypothetical protein B0G77_2038 [Paraburkholderia sp. BL10I2N1]